jgi:hypothetical protein
MKEKKMVATLVVEVGCEKTGLSLLVLRKE